MFNWFKSQPKVTQIRVDVRLHVEGVYSLMNSIDMLGESIMALSHELKDLTAKIDAATNEVAAEIAELKDKIANSMTDDEVSEVKAGLQAVETRLKGLAADPENPVPVQ